jgi:hypothetical protein
VAMTKRKLSTHGRGFDRTSSSVVLQTAKSLIRYLPVTIEASLLIYTVRENELNLTVRNSSRRVSNNKFCISAQSVDCITTTVGT